MKEGHSTEVSGMSISIILSFYVYESYIEPYRYNLLRYRFSTLDGSRNCGVHHV